MYNVLAIAPIVPGLPQVDVYTNHGIYPIAANMPSWQRDANRAIFDNLRQARQVVAVSAWTASQWERLTGRTPAGDPRDPQTSGDTWVRIGPGRLAGRAQRLDRAAIRRAGGDVMATGFVSARATAMVAGVLMGAAMAETVYGG